MVDEGEHNPDILAMNSDQAEDLRTLIGYVTEDGRGYEEFVDFLCRMAMPCLTKTRR